MGLVVLLFQDFFLNFKVKKRYAVCGLYILPGILYSAIFLFSA